MNSKTKSYHGYRFPREVISHGVWLYLRFSLSFREVEELLAERGIVVSYETVRQWCRKFGPECTRKLKRRQGRLGDVWHLDEVFIKIRGQRRAGCDRLTVQRRAHRFPSGAKRDPPKAETFCARSSEGIVASERYTGGVWLLRLPIRGCERLLARGIRSPEGMVRMEFLPELGLLQSASIAVSKSVCS